MFFLSLQLLQVCLGSRQSELGILLLRAFLVLYLLLKTPDFVLFVLHILPEVVVVLLVILLSCAIQGNKVIHEQQTAIFIVLYKLFN